MADKPIYQIFIHNHQNGKTYQPIIQGDVQVTLERGFKAGIMEFDVIKDDVIDYQEGNTVTFNVDGEMIYKAFVFRKKRTKTQIISTTCYDQIRYLKNKDTYQYSTQTMSDVLKQICKDRQLEVGEIEDTSYKIPKRLEDNQEYLNMLKVANDITLSQTGKLYTLFDDKGKISLKSAEKMIIDDFSVSYNNAVDFDYETSIDDGTYNRIVVYLVDDDGRQLKKVVKEDKDHIKKWGVLEYTVKTNNDEDIDKKAEQILEVVNRKYRKLTIKNVIGDIRVRAGSVIPVEMLAIGDINIQSYMLVHKVVHTFSENAHFMDLEVFNKDIMPIASVDNIIQDKPRENKVQDGLMVGGVMMPGGVMMRNDAAIEKMFKFAKSKLGKPYVWAAAGPNSFDCSGFVSWAAIQAGLMPPGSRITSGNMSSKYVHKVGWDQLQPGDILWVPKGYNKHTRKAGHVALYLGNGQYIEASGSSKKVKMSTLNGKGIFAGVYRFNNAKKAVPMLMTQAPNYMTASPFAPTSSGGGGGVAKMSSKMIRPVGGRISSNFGQRWGRLHAGTDYAVPTGTPVKAAQGGTVIHVGTAGSYGKLVKVRHPNGMETRYAHLSNYKVRVGDRVSAGQTIALSGNTGNSTGPHLHFEVRVNGKPKNPRNYV